MRIMPCLWCVWRSHQSSLGQHVLLHGRNTSILEEAEKTLSALSGGGCVESYMAEEQSAVEGG